MIKEFDLQDSLKLSGVIAAIFTTGVIINFLGYPELSIALSSVFSIPFIFLFLLEAILNRRITLLQNIGFFLMFSYSFWMMVNFQDLGNWLYLNFLFSMGLLITLIIVVIYQVLYEFIGTRNKRVTFFACFIPAVAIPSTLIFLYSMGFLVPENESFVDIWTIWHVLTGLVFGFLLHNKVNPKYQFELIIGLPILFEVIEQSLVASWLNIIAREFIGNSLVDILVFIPMAFIGIKLAERF